ncbi:ferric reductase-like transmembrane domain-containing protein [Helicobacter sp. 11S02629-2]|uniref:ferric reductase-like transmembrane domain-containing protein n=1 Tax=Helicobacter sp. 11S02629-2 TaxID=1476195 RepID=UPI000BA53E99|nr:ferric reductase-like transmembrane domain-containing protein [Helicobacter sp. 11S02629-2]PAF45885.1 hypothetical protein BKH40_00285 [Helicobacter sp. 11S02629-2]
MRKFGFYLIRVILVIILFIPLIYILYQAAGMAVIDKYLIHSLGDISIYLCLFLMIISLIAKPLISLITLSLFKFINKIAGIGAFVYAVLHILPYIILQQHLLFGNIVAELWDRGYLLIGLIALIIFLILFIFSFTKVFIKVSPLFQMAFVLGSMHFVLSLKQVTFEAKIILIISIVYMAYKYLKTNKPKLQTKA